MDKRTLLAIVLSLAVLMVYQIFFVKPPVPQKGARRKKQQSKSKKMRPTLRYPPLRRRQQTPAGPHLKQRPANRKRRPAT